MPNIYNALSQLAYQIHIPRIVICITTVPATLHLSLLVYSTQIFHQYSCIIFIVYLEYHNSARGRHLPSLSPVQSFSIASVQGRPRSIIGSSWHHHTATRTESSSTGKNRQNRVKRTRVPTTFICKEPAGHGVPCAILEKTRLPLDLESSPVWCAPRVMHAHYCRPQFCLTRPSISVFV